MVPGGAGVSCGGAGGAGTLRIEVDSPLVMIACGGSEARSLYLGGPPVERQRGRVKATEIVSWAEKGLVLSATVVVALVLVLAVERRDPGNRRALKPRTVVTIPSRVTRLIARLGGPSRILGIAASRPNQRKGSLPGGIP